MIDKIDRKISDQEYMQGLALFTMAQSHYNKGREFEKALIKLLGYESDDYGDCVSDAICNDGDFDGALAKDNITVMVPRAKKTRRK